MMVGCTLRDVWEDVRDATISLLGGVTFADLAKRAGGAWVDPSLVVPVTEPVLGRVAAALSARTGELRSP